MTSEHDQDWLGQYVVDVVRGALVFDRMNTMLMAVEVLAACDGPLDDSREWDAGTEGLEKIHIERIKDRFQTPTDGGWADCVVNFRFKANRENYVCEIQLIHNELMMVRERMGAHHGYSLFRSAYETLEKVQMLPPRAQEQVTEEPFVASEDFESRLARLEGRNQQLEELVRTNQSTIRDLRSELQSVKISNRQAGGSLPEGGGASPVVPALPKTPSAFPDALQLSRVLVSGIGVTTAMSRKVTTFIIHTYRSKLIPGSDKFECVIFEHPHSDPHSNRAIKGKVTDNRDGSHTVEYTVPKPGVYAIEVKHQGEHVPKSPFLMSCAD